MPRLSDTMDKGTVARWLKHEGDDVQKGEPIAEIETDKATMPLESFSTGRLAKILLTEGETVPIGTPIALVTAPGETLSEPEAPAATAATAIKAAPAAPPAAATKAVPAAPAETPKASPPAPTAEPAPEPAGIVRASPIARRLAEELGVDLHSVTGTGPGGRVTREDVEEAAAEPAATPVGASRAPAATTPTVATPITQPAPTPATAPPPTALAGKRLTRIQETIARRMVQSKTTVPHFYVTAEVDLDEAVRLRQQLIELWPEVRLGYTELIVKAVAIALQEFPLVNASWREDHLESHEDVNVGVAVSVENGLLVPVLHQVNQTNLRALAKTIKELAERTRQGKNHAGDFEGGTFTVSSLGQFAVENFYAIINPPESAILAVSRIEKKPAVKGDAVVISERVHLSLSCDHRVFYGTYAAQFMTRLKELLERPLALLS
jgi:pyruvate dehydrogenase E2 component (dihydrolipoamide acetyltransferase)